ncbi:DUF2922 family protein [Lacticaseibacillus suihuaensis]
MNDTVQLRLVFAAASGLRRTLTMSNIGAKPTTEAVETMMAAMANAQLFSIGGIALYVQPLEAWYIATDVEQIYQA